MGDIVKVTGTEYRHMTQVLRFKVGYRAILCDGSGVDIEAEITAIDRNAVTLRVTGETKNESELSYPLTIAMGLIKPEKMAIAVQKAVELGVTRIIPIRTRFTAEKNVARDRLQTIVREACKQCGRAVLPAVDDVTDINDLCWGTDLCYLAYEKERSAMLRDVLRPPTKEQGISVIVGSEGGFAEDEAAALVGKGAVTLSLGRRILRAETAVIVALGVITQLTEEL